jgi:flagellar assembly factor FliW
MWSDSGTEKPTMTPAIEARSNPPAALAELVGGEIFFPTGLLGFPDCRRFKLSQFEPGDGHDSPFFVLHSLDQELSFLVIHPDFIAPDYSVPVYPELRQALGAKSDSELLALLIVTVRGQVEDITVNLQGPLLVSTRSRIAMQLVLEEFPLRYPLLPKQDR